jgi:hypothetical protein
MRVHNVVGVLGVAGATMAFTLMVLGPWRFGISDETKRITPRIMQPKFASHGCDFTLKTGKTEYEVGETPVIEVTAVNPTGKAAEATVWIRLLTAEVPSPFARVMPVPRPSWSKSWSVSLKPGETGKTSLTADVKLAAKQNVMITISDAEREIMVKELPMRGTEHLTKGTTR